MAVDWGSKRIGLAISDATRKLARPLSIIIHSSREDDARKIIDLADEHGVVFVVVGVTFGDDHELTPSGRSAKRLADEIRELSSLKVNLCDEEFSTKDMKKLMIETGKSTKKRRGHADDSAAALLLQNFLDTQLK